MRNSDASSGTLARFSLLVFLLSLVPATTALGRPDQPVQVFADPVSDAIILDLSIGDFGISEPPDEFPYKKEGDVLIGARDYPLMDSAGDPALPYRILRVALPPEADPGTLRLEVTHLDESEIEDVQIAPAPPSMLEQMPPAPAAALPVEEIWGPGKAIVGGRNTLIYDADQLFPAEVARIVSTGRLRKWNIASIRVQPFRYNPVRHRVLYARQLTLKLTYERRPEALTDSRVLKLLRDSTFDLQAETLLLNYDLSREWYDRPWREAEELPRAPGEPPPPPPPPGVGYLIVTTEDLLTARRDALLEFGAHKSRLGFSVTVLTEHDTHAVEASDGGGYDFELLEESGYVDVGPHDDRASVVRQWLSQHYLDLGIEYVLLVGDPDPESVVNDSSEGDLPMRTAWPYPYQAYTHPYGVPTDLYFADLDGDWDLDGDGLLGEWAWGGELTSEILPDEVDPGRFSVRWEGTLEVDAGTAATIVVTIEFVTDGPVKVWIGDEEVLDEPDEVHPRSLKIHRNLATGTFPLKIEYRQPSGDACFYYLRVEGATLKTKCGDQNYEANYFDSVDAGFSGTVVADRCEQTPDLWLPGDRGPGGVDFFSEVKVGRIPFSWSDQVVIDGESRSVIDEVLRRIVRYESEDPRQAPWRRNVLCSAPYMYRASGVASGPYTEADYKGCETLRQEAAPAPLWSWHRIYDQSYTDAAGNAINPESLGCSVAETVNAWQEGRGVVMWRTHGGTSEGGIGDTATKVLDPAGCRQLDDDRPSIVLMMACANGLPEERGLASCLLERQAVATIAASRISKGGRFPNGGPKSNPWILHDLGRSIFSNVRLGDALARVREGETGNVEERPDVKRWWTVWNNTLAYNLYGDPSMSLFGSDVKTNLDLMLVLDGSGSMLREGKWQAAKAAAVLFFDILKLFRHESFHDRYSGVVFRCRDGSDDCAALFEDRLQDFSSPLAIQDFDAFAPVSGLSTPIGEGLATAIEQLELDSDESFYAHKVILLLSDGKQNCGTDPLEVPIPEGVRIYTVGLGDEDIRPLPLEELARRSHAEFRISPDPREMKEFFLQIAAQASWKIQDVPVEAGEAAVSQSRAAFFLIWDDPGEILRFELDPPGDGPNLTPEHLDAYPPMTCTYHPAAPGVTHAFYDCDAIPPELLGSWSFENIAGPSGGVDPSTVLLKVLEDPLVLADFQVDPADRHVGQPLELSVRLTEDGRPLTGVEDAYALLIRSPALALGTLLAEKEPAPDYPPASPDSTPLSHYTAGVLDRLGGVKLSKPGGPRVDLNDRGLGADRRAGDGIYTGIFAETRYQGSYTFRFRARGENRDGKIFDRTQTLSKYVQFAPSPERTGVETVSVELGDKANQRRATIRVTARDAFGEYLGPFQADSIQLRTSSGWFSTEVDDPKNGSYTYTLTYEAGTAPVISAMVGDVLVADRQPVAAAGFRFRGLSAHLGTAVPRGTLGSSHRQGWSVSIDFDFEIRPRLAAVFLIGYHRFEGRRSTDDTYWWSASANLKHHWKLGDWEPYVSGGIGGYVPKGGSIEPGLNLGLGLDRWLSPGWKLEGAVDYHHVFLGGSDEEFLISRIGLIFRF